MLVRQCNHCRKEISKIAAYIQISLESDFDKPSIGSGLPLGLQGDFCSVDCVRNVLDKSFTKMDPPQHDHSMFLNQGD